MRRTSLLAPLLVMVLLSAALLVQNSSEGQETPLLAEWTFMVYLDADNNLEGAGIEDMNEMESVGSTDSVNIVVQIDRIEGEDTTNGDWTDCRRYLIEKDDDVQTIGSPPLMELPEPNMGDPATLVDFAAWAVDSFPAKRYALVLWDHGGAFRGICYDDTVPGSDTYDMINMTELNQAMSEVYQLIGNRRIDLIGFDACLMAQLAILYELKDVGHVAAASGFNEPGDGWPYEEVLEPLVTKPEMGPHELATIISREYIYSYENGQEDPEDYPMVTMAGFDLTKMNEVLQIMDQLSGELASRGPMGSLEYLLQIYLARKNCNSYDAASVFTYDLTGYPLYDVMDYTKELEVYIQKAFPKNTVVRDLCVRLRSAIEPEFMFVSNADRWHPDANGLSEYFPNKDEDQLALTQLPTNYNPVYDETGFARHHLWDDFLHAYYGVEPMEDSPPTITITEPSYNSSFRSGSGSVTLRGYAYDRESIDRVEVRVDGGEWVRLPAFSGPGRIFWFTMLPVDHLPPGPHLVEARAWDVPAQGTTEGKVTAPASTRIFILQPPDSEDGGFELPGYVLEVVAAIVIICGLALGFILFRGRNE